MNIKERYEKFLRDQHKMPPKAAYFALKNIQDECGLVGHVPVDGKCANCGEKLP